MYRYCMVEIPYLPAINETKNTARKTACHSRLNFYSLTFVGGAVGEQWLRVSYKMTLEMLEISKMLLVSTVSCVCCRQVWEEE